MAARRTKAGSIALLPVSWAIYLVLPILMAGMGLVQILTQQFGRDKWAGISRTASVLLQAFCILAFVATRQPTAASLLFLFFMIKVVLLMRAGRVK